MPHALKRRKKRRKIVFMSGKPFSPPTRTPAERLEDIHSKTETPLKGSEVRDQTDQLGDAEQEEYISEEDTQYFNWSKSTMPDGPRVPTLFTSLPPIRDKLETETSKLQDSTTQECLPFLRGVAQPKKSAFDLNEYGVPSLEREKHIAFLHSSLGDLPAGFVGIDSSRPWMLYWALTGLSLLGEDISQYRERYVEMS